MENYGNEYFMSQEGYASIDFTLLDRPNSNIASAPESTAALLPDLHVGDSSFSSFDFLDGPSVEAFGGLERFSKNADEVHSRDQGGYQSDLHKYKKDRSVLPNSMSLPRGDGDPDSKLPSSEFHVPFEVQKPVSNLDFFSQGPTKDAGHQTQEAHSDLGNNSAGRNHEYFEHGQIAQQSLPGAGGAGGWYNTWTGSNMQGDQTQVFLQTPSYDEASEERRLMQMKGSSSQLGGQFGYHSLSSAAVQDCDPMPKGTHSFLPTTKQNDSRQTSNTGLGLPGAQANESASPVVKSSPRKQAFDYESLMNGSPANQYRRNSSTAVENTGLSRRHQSNDGSLGGHDALHNHAHSQSFKYPGQQLGSLAPVEVSPLKVNDYDFVGGQYVLKAHSHGEIGRRLESDEMQAWHEHPLLSQSNQQQAINNQQPYQELSRQHHRADQQSQNSRQHQFQPSLAVNEHHQSLGSQLSAFLTESSLQDLPRVAHSERQNLQLAAESPRGLLQTNYQTVNNMTNLNWSSTDPASMEGLAHDYLMGADQNFNWQALALKADPSLYGTVQSRRDPTGQPHSAYAGMQGGHQEYYNASGKLSSANAAQVGKPVVRTVGSGASGGSMYGSDYQAEVYDAAAANLQPMARSSKHQVLGKMPFWQAAYPPSVEHNRNATNLTQTNLPPRSPQVASNSPARHQRSWSGPSGQQDALSSGVFSQNVANAEALKQSLLASCNLQQSTHQAPNALTASRNMSVEAVCYYQQNSSQAGSGTQFPNALGTKQQSNWNRHSSQQSVPQAVVSGEASASLDSNQKKNWTSLHVHSKQASSESQSHSSLKQQNIWSGHTGQQNSGPASSLHLFTDLDGRRNSMHSSHDLQQQGSAQSCSSQQVEKVDLNPQLSHKISSSSLLGTEQPSTLLDLDTSQQSGWRDHSLLQGTTQTSNSLQAYQDLDKTSSWKNIWQTPQAEVPSQLMQMDDSRHETTLWGRNLQKASSQTVEPQVAAINPREQSSWNGRDVQQESPQTNQLLSSLDSHQGSHRSHSLDGRHCTDQFGHLLQDESALSKASASAEADAGQKASQNAYNVQVHLGTTDTGMRHKASQSTYGLQSPIVVEVDSRRKGNHSAYTLQSQLGVGEMDVRQKASQSGYSLHSQIGTAETDSRQKASQIGYSLQSQVGTGETDARRKASQGGYSLQSQVGAGETEARHKAASHNTYSVQSHLGTGETDAPQRGNQNAYNLQTQVAAVEIGACGKSSQNVYNVHSQGGTIDTDSRHKGGQNAFRLQAQLGAYSQQNSIDGRQPRSHWPHSSQQGISQTGVPMYSFPSLATKNQTAQNSLNLQTWNSAMNNVEGWQQKGTVGVGGQFQEPDLTHVENIDTRQQVAQSGSTSQHCSPQNESHLQSITNIRPPSRLGRLKNSQDNSLAGPIGTTASKSPALNPWQTQGNNLNSASPSQTDVAAMWSRGQNLTGRGDVEKFNLRGESSSGTSEGWTRGQKLTLQPEKNQLNLGMESDSCPNEALLHSWSHGQNLSSQKDSEQLNLGGVRKSGANEVMWSNGQNISVLKDAEQLNLAGESSSCVNAVTPTWARRQIAPVETEVKQLNFGGQESYKEMTKGTLPAWSHGQVTSKLKDVQELNHAGESHSGTKDLPLWTQGGNTSLRNVVDQLSHGVDSNSGINEVMPAWSREQVAPASIQTDQFNTGETNRLGGDAVPTWSKGRSIHSQRDDQVIVEEESNGGKNDSLPSWRQNMVAQKDVNQPDFPEDSNNCAINSGKDVPNQGLDVGNRGHKEVTFFDGGARKESNILASPAPSPDSNPVLSATKQKDVMKTSSLSRNTLELLSRPEETTESMSVNDEEEEEDLDMEDSGANVSSISLAHLRRNQASGPLSPQGFGLRLAPPSHLSQNSQAANSSRLGVDASRALSTQAHKVQQLAVTSSGSDQALVRKEDQLDSGIEVETSAMNHTPVLSVAFATANTRHNLRPKGEEHSSAEVVERSSAASSRLDGNASQISTTNALNSGETGQPSRAAVPIAPVEVVDEMVEVVSNDQYGRGSPFNSFHSNQRGPLTISAGQKQYFSPNPSAEQLPTGSEQADTALSKLLTFKDSLTGQVKSTFAQQPPRAEKGIPEKETIGGFESSRPPGFQSGHWSTDQSHSTMAKADLFKQIAAQVQSRGTLSSFDHLGTSSNSNSEKATTGSDAFLGQASTAGEFNSGERGVSQVPCLPEKSVASFQSHSYQARPGQESSAALLHSAQMYNQGDMIQGQGMATEFSNSGRAYSQGHGFTGQEMTVEQPQSGNEHPFQRPGDIPDQLYPGQQTYPQSQILPGQPNASGQSSPGEIFNSNQGLLSQSSTPGLPPPRQAFAQSASAGQLFPGPETPGQPVLGQRVGQVVAGKQLKSRQHRRVAQKGEETDVNHDKMEGKIASQLSSDSAPHLLASLQAFQAQNAAVQKQVQKPKEVSSRVPGLQDSIPAALETQSASRPLTEAVNSKDAISASNEGNEAVQKSNSREGGTNMQAPQIRSNHEQFGSRSENQGNLIQQWQNAMPLNSFPAITDQQFQRILEARPAIAAHLDTYKSDPRLYQLASAQIRASLGQAHMSRYQQQVRSQSAQATNSVANPASRSVASVQASQFQSSQAVHSAQVAQGVHATQTAQTVQSGSPADQAALAAQAAKHAHTAARLQYLSQLAQRGHGANGLSPWFSGLVARSGSGISPYTSGLADGKSSDPALANALRATGGIKPTDEHAGNRFVQNLHNIPPPVKKRKEYPPLSPWREAISQSGGYVSSTSASELEWALATNRIPDTEPYEEGFDALDTTAVVLNRAKRRLRLSTHLMQQITPAVPPTFMKSDSTEDREGATYTLSKLALAEACRIASIARRIRDVAAARDAEETRIEKERDLLPSVNHQTMKEAEKSGENIASILSFPPINITDRFKLRMKALENDLKRLETSPSAFELVRDLHDTERLSLVNRLAAHSHNPLQNLDARRASPQKYVTTVQMPGKLPEGLFCISL